MTNKEICYNYLTETAALSRAVAIGIMANISHESNFNPAAKGDNGTSYGICQWHKSRWDRLKTWCNDNGYSQSDLKAQLRFMLWEFRKYYVSAWDDMTTQPNTREGAKEVAYIMCVRYEIPANKEASGNKRKTTAAALWGDFSTTNSGNVEKTEDSVNSSIEPSYIRHRVKTGETLTTIAKQYGIDYVDIMLANPARWNPDLILAGEVLKIPKD